MGDEKLELLILYGEACGLRAFLDAMAFLHEGEVSDGCVAMSEAAGDIAGHFLTEITGGGRDADE